VAEKKQQEEVVAKRRICPEHTKNMPLPAQFPTLRKGMELYSVNGEEIHSKKYASIRNTLFKASKPQKLVFRHYPYTRDFISREWTAFSEMNAQGRYVHNSFQTDQSFHNAVRGGHWNEVLAHF
jgi:hypothetical protein